VDKRAELLTWKVSSLSLVILQDYSILCRLTLLLPVPLDPGTGTTWFTCATSTTADVPKAVESSQAAFLEYRLTNPRLRAELLYEWYRLINESRQDLATILTYESGKPLAESLGEIAYANGFTRWFAGEAERVFGEVSTPAALNRRAITIKQPVGVAVALIPWNFPISMLLRKAAAALAAGCTMIVKPSPETPLTAVALGLLAIRAGLPPGVLNVLRPDHQSTPSLSKALCEHDLVKKVTFTGSTNVGKLISSLCAPGLKKLTLELGGNCPFVVFDDSDLEYVAEQLMALKWRHAGQACIAANRIFVQDTIYDTFVQIMVDKTKRLVIGHGSDPNTNVGPMTTRNGVERAIKLVDNAQKHGGRVLIGGQEPTGLNGFFFNPTIIANANLDMDLARDELFCPVLSLFSFETEEQALQLANNTSMGLASYVFTRDVDRLWRMFGMFAQNDDLILGLADGREPRHFLSNHCCPPAANCHFIENLEAGMIGLNTGMANLIDYTLNVSHSSFI
jgi:succinate-semialdehyde dehydrogenase/glutarate-semialdehyde dehydrogenase